MAADEQNKELKMETSQLYREEVFTDRRLGSLMKLTPVDANGERDESRSVIYVGQSQVMTPAGALPLSFDIEAESLGEAADKFGDAARKAVDETMERLREMQRDAASSIVVPDGGAGGMGGTGGGAPGGFPGGGKIQLR